MWQGFTILDLIYFNRFLTHIFSFIIFNKSLLLCELFTVPIGIHAYFSNLWMNVLIFNLLSHKFFLVLIILLCYSN